MNTATSVVKIVLVVHINLIIRQTLMMIMMMMMVMITISNYLRIIYDEKKTHRIFDCLGSFGFLNSFIFISY